MTIKKTLKVKPIGSPKSAGTDKPASAPAAGNGAVADRFKLNAPPPAPAATGGTATTCALVAGLIALAVVGILTYVIWQHWEFLMPA